MSSPDPSQPRKNLDGQALLDPVASEETHGVLQPGTSRKKRDFFALNNSANLTPNFGIPKLSLFSPLPRHLPTLPSFAIGFSVPDALPPKTRFFHPQRFRRLNPEFRNSEMAVPGSVVVEAHGIEKTTGSPSPH
jgi:hypothetical protein